MYYDNLNILLLYRHFSIFLIISIIKNIKGEFFMANLKNILVEVLRYLYYAKRRGEIKSEEFLSEKICYYTIKIRKKIVRKTNWLFAYGQLIFSLGNELATRQAIGLPILLSTSPIMKSIYSNAGLSKKTIIAHVT